MSEETTAREGDSTKIDRVEIASLTAKDFYLRFLSGGAPVILTGVLHDVQDWTLPLLREHLAGEIFPARHYGVERFTLPKTQWKTYCDFKSLPFEDYVEMLADGRARHEKIYMAQVEIGATRAAIPVRGAVERLHRHTGLERNPQMDLNLWLGAGGHTEPLHFDSHDGTLMQLHGAKRVLLFPPSQTENLYPFAFFGGGLAPWFSQVYLDKPDFAAYPHLQTALKTKLEVTVNQGEVLYIPANWWHEVSALGSEYVCSLNRFWKVKPTKRLFVTPRSAALYFLMKIPIQPLLFVHGGIVKIRKLFSERTRGDVSLRSG